MKASISTWSRSRTMKVAMIASHGQLSSDLVRKNKPYTEEDIPNSLNIYGNSKLAGEYFVRNIVEKHYIIRPSSLFGAAGASGKGGNFVETMIKKAQKGEEIKVG